MANNLKDHLKEVADAIRAKKGTTDLINPQDFATEIKSIESGGTESSIEYLDVREVDNIKQCLYAISRFIRAINASGSMTIMSTSGALFEGLTYEGVHQLSLDFNELFVISPTVTATVKEWLLMLGVTQEQLDAIPRITKEQFYDLTYGVE